MRAFGSYLLVAAFVFAPSIARAQDQGGDAKPADTKPTDTKPADTKPADSGSTTPAPAPAPGSDDSKPGKKGREGKGQRKDLAERLKGPLQLSDDQVKKIKEIEEQVKADARKALKANGTKPDQETRRKQMRETM